MTSPIIPTSRRVTLVSRAARGGHPRYCAELANALHHEGAEVVIIEPADAFDGQSRLHPLGVENLPISGPDSGWLRQEFQIAKHLLRQRKNGGIVVFHDTSPIRIVLLTLLRLSRDWTPVSMVHNTEPHGRSTRERVKHLSALASLAVPHRVVVHNERQREQLGQRPFISAGAIDLVPHGVWSSASDGAVVEPQDLSTVLMFGVMRHNSGIENLLAAAPAIEATLPECKVRVVGSPADSAVARQLSQLAAFEAFDVQAEFVSDDEADRLFANAAWILLPYTDYASESGVLVMAVAHGRPVITFGSTSIADRVTALGLGPTPQPTLLATLQLALKCSDDEYRTWARNAREARHVFSWSEHAKRLLDPQP